MIKKKFTYKKSGVDIDSADNFIKFISKISSKKKGKKKFSNIGGFGSITDLPKNIKNPKIVACTDGVGTKIEIANELNKYDSIGIDLVAMSVNDLIVQGAKPLLFLDYISINKINLLKLKSIIKGIVKGCEISGCELVGGETAEMPGTYEKGKFDIAGFAVGIVDQNKLLNKNKINIRRNNFVKNELLKPTKIYVKEILNLINKDLINGCANITGGGIPDNIKRVIPDNLIAEINLNLIKPTKIFKWLKNNNIDDKEILRTFNCGVGFCLIINPQNLSKIKKYFSKEFQPYVIGKISKGNNKVRLNDKIHWS